MAKLKTNTLNVFLSV